MPLGWTLEQYHKHPQTPEEVFVRGRGKYCQSYFVWLGDVAKLLKDCTFSLFVAGDKFMLRMERQHDFLPVETADIGSSIGAGTAVFSEWAVTLKKIKGCPPEVVEKLLVSRPQYIVSDTQLVAMRHPATVVDDIIDDDDNDDYHDNDEEEVLEW